MTVEPEESLALPSEKVPAPPLTKVCAPGAVQLMLWLAPLMVMLLGLPTLSTYWPCAGAVGVMVQVPALTIVTVVSATVQMLVVELAKVTVEPEESLALPSEKVPAPPTTQVFGPGAVQVMVWLALENVTVVWTEEAAL